MSGMVRIPCTSTVLLVEKLSPNDVEVGKKYAEKSFFRTEIIRLDVTEFSGKTKKMG